MTPVKVKKLHPQAKIPTRGTENSAGLDLYLVTDQPHVYVLPGQTMKLCTGIAMEIPPGYEGEIRDRSSLGFSKLRVFGTIDSDFRGEITVPMTNHGQDAVKLLPGDRIAQIVIGPCLMEEPVEVEELSETKRGSGGFGSTGR